MMIDLLPPWPLLSVFLAASFVLAITPGPGVFYIVTRSVTQGRRSGVASVAGVAVGNFGNALAASLGLAALFAASSLAFSIMKYAGAAYLIYLGIKALRSKSFNGVSTASATKEALPMWPIFRDGLVVALFNPKTTIFYAAFLPQFMSADVHGTAALSQAIALAALFVLIAAATDATYALLAGAIAPRFAGSSRVGIVARCVSGFSFIALGIFAALSEPASQSKK
jgi:threonine/homoserine/homoserine lactone efflux protein